MDVTFFGFGAWGWATDRRPEFQSLGCYQAYFRCIGSIWHEL
jgi:hypothetical protein